MDTSTDRVGAGVRAPSGARVTMVRVSGELDVRDVDSVTAYAVRSALMDDAVLLDMTGVKFFAIQGISVLFALDKTCHGIGLPWALVASRAVERVLRVSGQADAMPMANSAAVAVQYFADLARPPARPRCGENPT